MSVQEITDLYNREIPKLFKTRMSWGEWSYSWISPSSWKESLRNNWKRITLSPPTETIKNSYIQTHLGHEQLPMNQTF